jgi:hypothetical protein
MLPRPPIRGSPSICGYIIVLALMTIKKEEPSSGADDSSLCASCIFFFLDFEF